MHRDAGSSAAALRGVLAGLLAWIGCSCGGGGAPSEDPCAACAPGTTGALRCFVDPAGGAPVGCAPLCAAGPCPGGSACVAYAGEQVCSPCSTALCPARKQCAREGTFSSCVDVPGECSDRVPCLSAADVCEPSTYACYPANGDCTARPCPHLEREYPSLATTCVQGFCRIAPTPPRQVSGMETAEVVPVARPRAGESFASREDVLLEWDAGGNASIALVFASPPASALDFDPLAIWEGDLAAGYDQRVSPANSGHPVAGGSVDTSRTGLDTRAVGTLWFHVRTVEQGTRCASVLVPFFVGGSWPVTGVPCSAATSADAPGIPGECASPSEALACIEGTCRRLCASHLDCPADQLCSETRRLATAAGSAWYRTCD